MPDGTVAQLKSPQEMLAATYLPHFKGLKPKDFADRYGFEVQEAEKMLRGEEPFSEKFIAILVLERIRIHGFDHLVSPEEFQKVSDKYQRQKAQGTAA